MSICDLFRQQVGEILIVNLSLLLILLKHFQYVRKDLAWRRRDSEEGEESDFWRVSFRAQRVFSSMRCSLHHQKERLLGCVFGLFQ